MISISVIIPCFNAERTLDNCIISIVNGLNEPNEIIIIDDCSTDTTPLIAEKYLNLYPHLIRFKRLSQNSGPATARNIGAEIAKSDYLFFVDSDTELLKNTLTQFSCSIKKNQVDAVVGIYHSTPANKGIAQRYKAYFNFYFFTRLGVIPYEVFDSSRAGIKRDIFLKSQGFNTHLKAGMDYENEEFGYRLTSNYKIILDPSIMVKHNFPDFSTMIKTYFWRTSLWAEIFFKRKKFESGGVTSATTGVSTLSLLISLTLVLNSVIFFRHSVTFIYLIYFSSIFFLIYLVGYLGFFTYILRNFPSFIIHSILFNIFFTLLIAVAAIHGFIRSLLLPSKMDY